MTYIVSSVALNSTHSLTPRISVTFVVDVNVNVIAE